MRLRAVIVAAALAGPWPALAESVVVGDNTHAVGWPVFDQQGHLGFVGCDGTTKPMARGRQLPGQRPALPLAAAAVQAHRQGERHSARA